MGNGLTTEEEKTIAAVFAQVPAIERAVLFGSRAMGLARSNSDVDIALYGEKLGLPDILYTASLLEDTPLPYQFDLISYASITSPDLLEHIRQYGKEMYRKMEKMNVIPFGWTITKLGNLGEVNRGRSRHRPRYAKELYGGPYPFIQTGDIKASNGRINSHTQTYNEKGLAQSRLWPKETMCITIAANIAETGILCYPACFPDSVIGFIANKNKCDVYFIEYMFRFLRRKLKNEATGSVQDNINLQTLERLEFLLPPLAEQKRIAQVLNSLDDKIENNRKINQCLEQMAQAIFKSWFVDFEPWGGVMPNDWKKTQFGEISTIQNGYAFKSEDYCDDGCRMIRTTNICDGYVNNDDLINLPKSFYSDCKYKNFIFKCFDTVLVMVGASVGKIGLITKKNIPSLQNQNMWRFRPKKDNISVLYVHYYTKLINDSVRSWSNGSAREFYRKDIFKKAPCFLPTDSIMSDFNLKTLHLFKKISNNLEENEKLAEIRDTLLPKLLSGEIRIPEAEKIVEEKE